MNGITTTTKPWKKTQNNHSHSYYHYFSSKFPWKSILFYTILSLILFLCYFSPFSLPNFDQFSFSSSPSNSSQLPSLPTHQVEISNRDDVLPNSTKVNEIALSCDYTDGEWIKDKMGPLYNGSSCGTIKDGQNCMLHGRPDTDYLYWKWKPRQCDVSRFDPESFLRILEGKHLAFVGDSLARNQLESLLCMLASFSRPNLVYSNGDDNKFRRWNFASHNVTISVYWSPFLVKGIEKANDRDYNRMELDSVDERWANDLGSIDMVILSIGHWYLLRAMYFDRGTEIGCHSIEGGNCTDIGFYDPYGKAFNTSLNTIVQRKSWTNSNGIDVIVTTFSPHHFEGEWDKLGACSKTMPYKEGEKGVDGMNDILRKIAVAEAENVQFQVQGMSLPNVRVAPLDVTKLSLLRPDGHPGPYMYWNPFADGIKERVHNDCVHWCLPGPIDTWNEIMLDIIKRWHVS